jgi:hypothetical protein
MTDVTLFLIGLGATLFVSLAVVIFFAGRCKLFSPICEGRRIGRVSGPHFRW